MKRAIIVLADGYETQDEQAKSLAGVPGQAHVVRAMTAEDRYYQFQQGLQGLDEGDEVHVAHLHYLGESLTQIVHALADLNERGLRLVSADANEEAAELPRAATVLRGAERQAMAAQVAGLKKKAAARRSATPPKCILIPVEFAD